MQINEKKKYLTSLKSFSFDDLLMLVNVLRSKEGCPWDKEQTHKTLRSNLIEETYEVIEAIDTENNTLLREELGDLLLQIVFHADIEDENKCFGMSDVIGELCEKLIIRHPHVFGDLVIEDSEGVLKSWNSIKETTKHRDTETSKLRAIPPMLPSLMRAQKVGKKASCFDFANTEEVYAKIYEELGEVKEAERRQSKEELEEEIGDLLLAVTSLSRKLGVDSEEALSRAVNKFIDRFEKTENACVESGVGIKEMPRDELENIWNSIKH